MSRGAARRSACATSLPALLFLGLGVIAPTACVVWFMNEAASAQADAARQSIAEAYRGQLRFLRDRVDFYWKNRAASLELSAGKGSAADFERDVKAGLADSFVLAKYPTAGVPIADPAVDRADWRAGTIAEDRHNAQAAIGAWAVVAKSDANLSVKARAAQAEIRWLARTDKEAALRAIGEYFDRGPMTKGADQQGRLIAADEQLLALRLMQPRDTRHGVIVRRLAGMLNDYQGTAMPSAQRLFLMDEVRGIAPGTAFPTYEAERLAAEFLEGGDARSGGSGLQPTSVPELWKLPSKSGRVTALYRTSTVLAATETILAGGKGVRFAATPPSVRTFGEAIAAGAMLPGWQLSASIVDPEFMEQAARRRMASYLWAGYLVIGMMAITSLLAGQSFRKQMRLARLKTDLVAAVSHELKTPLSSMRLLVDSLLADEVFEAKKTREYLQLMSGENTRLTRLVENFLTFSRIERNRQRFEFQRVRPGDVVASAAGVMRERFPGAGCDFQVDVEDGLPAINADPDALLTALVNLLDNAYKYTPGEKRICLRAFRDRGQIVFEVEDNGIGIAAREQKRIFRRFYQVDSRLARETGGCGLGLSIVESIVRAHGGSVRVTSRLGSGSTFSVFLPGGTRSEKAPA
ncbi:MAG TPA: HAMP domain-containing sensor histidine kinase [Bryobacteraceae bacterium]|nr:HAMP domain-containing sensor histidine kinase [Bryobacteraceae bacterium]